MTTEPRRFPVDRPWMRTLAWVGTGLLAVVTLYVGVRGSLDSAIAALVFLSIALALLFTDRLPPLVGAAFAGAALLATSGWALGLFDSIDVYDELAHLTMSFSVGLAIAHVAAGVLRADVRAHDAAFVVIVAALGLGVGALWEWFELVMGSVGGVGDTLADLLIDAIGAAAAGVLVRFSRADRRSGRAPLRGGD